MVSGGLPKRIRSSVLHRPPPVARDDDIARLHFLATPEQRGRETGCNESERLFRNRPGGQPTGCGNIATDRTYETSLIVRCRSSRPIGTHRKAVPTDDGTAPDPATNTLPQHRVNQPQTGALHSTSMPQEAKNTAPERSIEHRGDLRRRVSVPRAWPPANTLPSLRGASSSVPHPARQPAFRYVRNGG